MAELGNCSPDELQRLARDVGVSSEELVPLAGKWPDSANLLARRMAALQLDPSEIASSQPAVANDLRRLCSLCVSKGRCTHDFASGANNSNWQEYCPNKTTLTALSEQRAAEAANGKKQ
jgi:hypothetical protein